MQNIKELTSQDFNFFIENNSVVIVYFWAELSDTCKRFEQVYKTLAQEYPEVNFTKINIDNDADLAASLHIKSIPHILVYKDGLAIYSEFGSVSEGILKELIDEAIELDVTDLRKSLDKE